MLLCIYRNGYAWKCFSRPWQWMIFKTITINSNTQATETNTSTNKNKCRLRPKWNEHIWPVCGHGNWFQLYCELIHMCFARLMYTIHTHIFLRLYICAISFAKPLFSVLPTTWIKVPESGHLNCCISVHSFKIDVDSFVCVQTTQPWICTCKIRFQFIHSC